MSYRILAVDDDQKALTTIKYYIEMTRSDIEFFEATTCEKALEIFEDKLPHLVITELNLPDGKGEDLVFQMKEINPLFQLIIQASETDYNISVQRSLRCIDFFIKPFGMEIFSDALNYALEHVPKPKEEKIIVVQGDSHTVIRVDELLGGETVKSEAKLLLYIYKYKINELRTIQLDDITLMKFLEISRKYTDAIVQCQKSYFVNVNRVQKLDTKTTPAELVMEYGEVKFPVGKKFLKEFKKES